MEEEKKCKDYKIPVNAEELKNILEDWKMTKDRIAHFDTIINQTRLQGIPIATGIQTAGFVLGGPILDLNPQLPVLSLIMLASIIVILPIYFLDRFYLDLLLKSVQHAECIEKLYFKDQIQITNRLTSDTKSKRHKNLATYLYFAITAIAIILGIYGAVDFLMHMQLPSPFGLDY